MKITVAKDAGYCFGVRDAVNMAYDATSKYGEVYMLGAIVHNEKVVKNLERSGAKIVDSLSNVPKDSPILFRAHGTVNELWTDAKEKEMNIIDATCPLVYEIHRDVKKLNEDFEKPMVKLLSKLEINGIKIDDIYLKKLSKNFAEKLKELVDDLIDRHKDMDEFEKELEKYKKQITPGQVGES